MPVQKLCVESYREQMAGQAKALTALGSYWKGRKPLILNKACILGLLLPATDDHAKDLEIFELLMGMDNEAMAERLGLTTARWVVENVKGLSTSEYFACDPVDLAPDVTPFTPRDIRDEDDRPLRVAWRPEFNTETRRRLAAEGLPKKPYRELASKAKRPDEASRDFFDPIWKRVNDHLGTDASSFPELIEQLGIARFGHRPVVADTFCGSGQIPFEAARLGCDVFASDLNPIACMLTWAAFHMVGATPDERNRQDADTQRIIDSVLAEIRSLGIDHEVRDGIEWKAKAFLYCLETQCPQTGWMVPLLSSRIVSKGSGAVARLVPDPTNKRYDIEIDVGVKPDVLADAASGTVRDDDLVHTIGGVEYRTPVKTLRGDFRTPDGDTGNKLRLWEKEDFEPRRDDIFQERLYCIQWLKVGGRRGDYEFRSVTNADIAREHKASSIVQERLQDWQNNGLVPNIRIEPGAKTSEPTRTRGWTYWHHLWPPRQLIYLATIKRHIHKPEHAVLFASMIDFSSKLGRWTTSGKGTSSAGGGGRTGGASNNTANVFYNQALNTFYNYGIRSADDLFAVWKKTIKSWPISSKTVLHCCPASVAEPESDLVITDPPYGDAVRYEEILEFFIAWLRGDAFDEVADWVWDSRRELAIQGNGESFRQRMVRSYSAMTESMPDNGLQIIMFTHQSGAIWADMANIVWASGLQVTAAWYVVTETDSSIRTGSNVKGTVLLVLRKRNGNAKSSRDDLAWELEEEVRQQIKTLTGLNQEARGLYRDENLFAEADLQMAGYAAALRVLTRYSVVDGRNMVEEAIRPRVRNEKTFVDELIDFAVGVANSTLVPQGISEGHWRQLAPIERFYIKMLNLEAQGLKTLDNYQNFAKAFKVSDFRGVMQSARANSSRLKSAAEFKRNDMSEGSPLHNTPLRAILYALMELGKDVDTDDVLSHLAMNVPNYYAHGTRDLLVALCQYLGTVLESIREEEASNARVLAQSVRNQRM
jgi:putative DNA methylase